MGSPVSPFRRCPFWEQELANKYSCKLVGLCPLLRDISLLVCMGFTSGPSYFACEVVITRDTASFLSDLRGPTFLVGLKTEVWPSEQVQGSLDCCCSFSKARSPA